MSKLHVQETLPIGDAGARTTRRHVTVAVAVYCPYDDGLDEWPEDVPLETQRQSRVRHVQGVIPRVYRFLFT